MLANFFRKSNLNNQSVLIIMALALFIGVQARANQTFTATDISLIGLRLLIWFVLLLLTQFIAQKNDLTRNSSYALLFYIGFQCYFPNMLLEVRALLAQLLLLMAQRRLLSLQTLNAPKEKILDATLLIGIASLLYFWLGIFILLIYISIIFDVSRSYRNWIIPIVGALGVALGANLLSFFVDYQITAEWQNIPLYEVDWNRLMQQLQFVPLTLFSVFVVYFTGNMMVNLQSRPIVLQGNFKKLITCVCLVIIAYLFDANKTFALLGICFFPLSLMGASQLEYLKNKWVANILLFLFLSGGIYSLLIQL